MSHNSQIFTLILFALIIAASYSSSEVCNVSTRSLQAKLDSVCSHTTLFVTVTYHKELICDHIYSPQLTKVQPSVKMEQVDPEKYFTLLMVDPDAPGHSIDTMRFWLHWAVTDIKGADLKKGVVTGRQLMDYRGPTPPSGIHRYQILIFESRRHEVELTSTTRNKFSLSDFVNHNALCKLDGLFEYRVPA